MATRLEQIVKRAKELKKTAPASTKWTDLIKKASKQVTPVRAKASNKAKAVRNLGLSGVKKKRSTKAGSHKDTRSHNVNIKVVSGTKKIEKNFYSEGYGLQAQLISNYYLLNRRNGGGFVTILNSLQRISKPETDILNDIVEQTGRRASGETEELLREWLIKLQKTLKPVTKKAVKKVPTTKTRIMKARTKTRTQESEAIREKVRKDGFILPHGYAVQKAKRISGYVGRVIIKKFTLSELKKLNPIYFEKGTDKLFGVYKRKLMISNLLQSQVMIEAYKVYYPTGWHRSYGVRKIEPNGKIESPKYFDNLLGASNYVGKNIIL